MKMRSHPVPFRRTLRRGQRGISLLFALMSLVILGFAAAALTRSVDTGTLIMGNLAFKQDALVASSRGAEEALSWLQGNINSATLNTDQTNRGYYASAKDQLDVTGGKTSATDKRVLVNWNGDCGGVPSANYDTCDVLPFTGTKVNGNKIQWIVTRLCDTTGPASGGNLCVRPATTSTAATSDRGALDFGGRLRGGIASPYFRIVVRAEGPRNTVSYTETLVHF